MVTLKYSTSFKLGYLAKSTLKYMYERKLNISVTQEALKLVMELTFWLLNTHCLVTTNRKLYHPTDQHLLRSIHQRENQLVPISINTSINHTTDNNIC